MAVKTLTNTSDVIDAWASQDRPAGKAGVVSFDGQRLFSYSTPVAAIVVRTVDAHAPLRIVLSIYRRHSITTSGHVSAARSAAQHAGLASIAVATIDAPLDHQRNLLGIAEDAMSHLRKAGKARVHAEGHQQRAKKRLLELNLYAKFFGLGYHVPVGDGRLPELLEDFIGQLQQTATA
jgi:hypothetical protein